MRIAHRRGVVEGVVVGAAIAGSRRPPAVAVVPAYGYGAVPVGAGAMYGAAAMGAAARPTTEVIVNPGPGYMMPPNPGYYPPPQGMPMQPAMSPYPAPAPYSPPVDPYSSPYQAAAMPPPMVAPAPMPPPYAVPAAAPAPAPAYIVEPPAPAIVPAAIAAGAAVKAAEVIAIEKKAFERRPCFLVNEMTGSVLEVRRGNAKPGAEVVLEKRHKDRPRHQQWYLDEHGIIHSCLNDFVMESKANGEHLRMMPMTGDARQKWTHQNNRIVNAVFCNDCIGAKKGLIRVKDDADVISCVYEGKPYQNWRVEYVL